jgi:hypothetical protein
MQFYNMAEKRQYNGAAAPVIATNGPAFRMRRPEMVKTRFWSGLN